MILMCHIINLIENHKYNYYNLEKNNGNNS